MVENVKILCARRAYEFLPDDLRLTLLTTSPVRQKIVSSFAFHSNQLATPMETFGPVPRTLPPGVVFNWGSVELEDKAIAPIRFLHFEPQRIVVDVAGPSSVVDLVYGRLMAMLADDRTPDGSPAIGVPSETHDWSEISLRLGFRPIALVPRPIRDAYERAIKAVDREGRLVAIPHLAVQPVPVGQPYPGTPTGTFVQHSFALDLRKDSPLDSNLYFSSAPLNTEAHLMYLRDLEAALSSSSEE